MKTHVGRSFFSTVLTVFMSACSSQALFPENETDTSRFIVGTDNAGECMRGERSAGLPPSSVETWWKGLDMLGVEFISYHSWYNNWQLQDTDFQVENARRLGTAMEEQGMQFLLNLELANWRINQIDRDGHDWVKRPNGAHGFNFKSPILEALIESPAFLGVIYDEIGHMLVNRNRFAGGLDENGVFRQNMGDYPLFVETNGAGSVPEAHALFVEAAKQFIDELKEAGVKYVISEHAFPVIHPFVEAGFIPAPKLLKESWAPVIMAIGMGAALQYDRELWVCVDLWDRTVEDYPHTFPGHNSEKMKSALSMAYWLGADRVYVENYNYKESLVEINLDYVRLTKYGEVLRWFNEEYLPVQNRSFSFRDINPEVAIIRMEDTDFGLANNFWKDQLYGAKNLQSCERTKRWMKVWHLLTHRMVPYQAIDWNASHVYQSMGSHVFFAPVNNVVVFDHQVQARHLETLKLAFLCGLHISDETLAALRDRVKDGLIVVADPLLVYPDLQDQHAGGTTIIMEGKGKWVLADEVFDPEVEKIIANFLGSPDEIRYVFGDQTVVFKGASTRDDITISIE